MNRAVELTKWIFLYFYLTQCVYARRILEEPKIHFLNPGDSVENNHPGLKTYCHIATSKYLTHIWKTMTMHLNINSDSYVLYDGKSSNEILQKHDENQGSWSLNLFDTKKHKQLKVDPFEDMCIGVYTDSIKESKYIMSLSETRINVWRLTMMIIGIIIFITARILSQNTLFYYACGIACGVSLSIIILIYMAGKLIPWGKGMYLFVAASMSLYLAQALWENAQLIAIQYREWVMWYILVTSLISFIICYRFGPVTNMRTKKIIQWFLQFVGLLLIYYSSHFYEASFSCCILLLILYHFPRSMISRSKQYWQNIFPEKRKLLNEDQYRQEGIRETRKALKQLQRYCASPDCNSWKTVLKLKDPIRFAKFVEGNSHLSENEIDEHEEELSKSTRVINKEYFTDDDDY